MPIDESLPARIETYLTHLGGLIRRGRQLRANLADGPGDRSMIAALRAWQEDCGVTINQLSGGSKSHWLARSFSEAFLMRSADGRAVESAAPSEIVARLIDVLEKAAASLSVIGDERMASAISVKAPPPHQFDFVHNAELRPILEQSYIDSRVAFERSDYESAMRTSCGILEAIVTDALAQKGLMALAALDAPPGTIADWSFETRLTVAERAGLIRGGCARLSPVARTYRDQTHADGASLSNPAVSERDARVAGQVLRVIMRDLDPGR